MDINNFGPFNVDVWGSVSDWVMIIVTSLTAYYLYHTLRLQRKQSELEFQRHVLNISPEFEIKENIVKIERVYNGDIHIRSSFVFNFKRRYASYLTFHFPFKAKHPWDFKFNGVLLDKELTFDSFNSGVFEAYRIVSKESKYEEVTFSVFIEYSDAYKNKYRQAAVFTFNLIDMMYKVHINPAVNHNENVLSL